MKRYAIVGFGCAGYHASKTLRQLCPGSPIDVYEKTGEGTANPMLTTYYASGKIGRDMLFPFGDLDKIKGELSLNVVSSGAFRVEPVNRAVETENGDIQLYDEILVSTGASASKPDVIGLTGGKIFYMRTVKDAEHLKAYLDENRVSAAAVIGASMVGIKAAELLRGRGIKTTLLDAAPAVFPLAAYESTAKRIESELSKEGLDLRMDVSVSAVGDDGVAFGDGSFLKSDLTCLCIGSRANVDLVANIEPVEGRVLINRGVVVNEKMRTNRDGIYGAGDCCEGLNLQTGENMIIGLWANAAAQGECAARNMAGLATRFSGSFPHNITHFFGMTFAGLGDPALPGERRLFKREGLSVEAAVDSGRLRSVNILGDCRVSGVIKSILLKQLSDVPPKLGATQRSLLCSAGLPDGFVDWISDMEGD